VLHLREACSLLLLPPTTVASLLPLAGWRLLLPLRLRERRMGLGLCYRGRCRPACVRLCGSCGPWTR